MKHLTNFEHPEHLAPHLHEHPHHEHPHHEHPHHEHPHHGPHHKPGTGHHLMPHHHDEQLRAELYEHDTRVLSDVFGDELTSTAAVKDISKAPPEMTILAIMAIDLATAIRQQLQKQELATRSNPVQVVEDSAEVDCVNQIEFDCSALTNQAQQVFCNLYGEDRGNTYYKKLRESPHEIAAIARILAYLKEKVGVLSHEHH